VSTESALKHLASIERRIEVVAGLVKQCKADPAHLWATNLPYCPYCNLSAEARVLGAKRQRVDEREMRKLNVAKDRRRA